MVIKAFHRRAIKVTGTVTAENQEALRRYRADALHRDRERRWPFEKTPAVND
jgi:hypothetical protein